MGIVTGNSQNNLTNDSSASQQNSLNSVNQPPSIQNTNPGDQLKSLPQFGWKTTADSSGQWIYFPVTNIRGTITQQLAVHEYPDLDAARVENTGRKPITISCHAIFLDTIKPTVKESWKAGTLFPGVWNIMLNAAMQRQTGTLQVPGFTTFTAKLQSCNIVLDANVRAGGVLELSWIETINDNNILTNIQSQVPQIAGAISSINASFLSLLSYAVGSISAKVSNFLSKYLEYYTELSSLISQTPYLNPTAIAVAIQEAQTKNQQAINEATAANDVVLANLLQQLWALQNQLLLQQQSLGTSSNQNQVVATYITPIITTFPQIANKLDQDISDLMQLNPQLLGVPSIPAYSSIRYYS